MKRVAPSKRISKAMEELLSQGTEGYVLAEFLKLGKQLLIQQLLEQEVEDFLGRGHYERRKDGEFKGYRNGYEPRKLKDVMGELELMIPQVRQTPEPFVSRIARFFKGHTDLLDALVVEMYTRGLSTRDIEDTLVILTGEKVLSKSSVSRVTENLWEEYQAFSERDLSHLEVEYLFLDAIYESLRRYGDMKEAVLCAWGITSDGRKVLISLGLGNKESYDSWLEFLRDMVSRGMRDPVGITTDGAPGLIKAVEAVFPKSVRIRCWYHKMSNLRGKVPEEMWPDIKAQLVSIRDAATYQQGLRLAQEFIDRYEKEYPSLIKAFKKDLQALLSHLRFPIAHRKAIRTTNLIERSFEEERRRSKVIPRFLTEKGALKLVYGVLIRASTRWRRVKMTERERHQLRLMRESLGIAEKEELHV